MHLFKARTHASNYNLQWLFAQIGEATQTLLYCCDTNLSLMHMQIHQNMVGGGICIESIERIVKLILV